jgi:hypothetical protein
MSTRALKATVVQCRGIVRGTSFAGSLQVRLAHTCSERHGPDDDSESTRDLKSHDIVVDKASSVPVPASKPLVVDGS